VVLQQFSFCPETIFSSAKFVVNGHRTVLAPKRAEQLILSAAARYKMKLFGKNLPKLPQLGEIEQLEDTIPADDGSDSDSDAEEGTGDILD
jgi:hypothetical protein